MNQLYYRSDRRADDRAEAGCFRHRKPIIQISILLLLSTNVTFAQKAPELGYVFPPVVQIGTKTEVQLGGYDMTPDMEFFVHDEQVTLSVLGPPGEFIIPKPPYWFGEKSRLTAFLIPREIPARIEVPSDHPPGLVRWQVANANGSSATAVFLVSSGPETIEARDRNHPQLIQQLPIGVSGRLERIAEVDQYLIETDRDGPITLELFARRLGADFNAHIEVHDLSGRLIADVADTEGVDAALTFVAKAIETYRISLHDVDFRGNRAFVYRLAITPGPRVITTIPAAGKRGETREVEFVGYGVASGSAKLESTKQTITFPADTNLHAMHYQLMTPYGSAPPIEIPLGELTETSINNSQNVSHELSVPGAVTAVLGSSGEAGYTWKAKKDDFWNITAQSRSIGTNLDLSISILDSDGKQLATNDDLPGSPDAGLQFTAPQDGTYTCQIIDLSGRSGRPSSVYRLALKRQGAEFSLSIPQQLTFGVPGKAQLEVKVTRYGGHNEEIMIETAGLPTGVSVPVDLKISAGQSSVKIPFEAAEGSASQAALVQIIGKSKVGNEIVSRVAGAKAGGNLCSRDVDEKQTSNVLLATTLKPRFTVELIDKNRQRAVHRGTTYPAPFIIKREEGFVGEVFLQMAARQGRHRQGIHGPVITVPAGTDQALYPSFMPEWLETDRTTRMVVLGMAQQPDLQGNLRYVTQPADARITMILEGALLKVSHRADELKVTAGNEFQIPIDISRSSKLQKVVSVELVIPDELAGLIKSVPARLDLAANQNQAILTVQTKPNPRLTGRWKLGIRATALQDDRWPVISRTETTVEFVEASEGSESAVSD